MDKDEREDTEYVKNLKSNHQHELPHRKPYWWYTPQCTWEQISKTSAEKIIKEGGYVMRSHAKPKRIPEAIHDPSMRYPNVPPRSGTI